MNAYTESDRNNDKPAKRKLGTGAIIGIIGGIVTFVTLVIGLLTWFVFIPNSVISEGKTMEGSANTFAGAAFGAMDKCVQDTLRSAQVANANTAAVTEVLEKAVGGRYNKGDELDKVKLYSALQEAYPDTSGVTKLYDKALSTITGCQADFVAAQTTMINYANTFDAWRSNTYRTRTFGGDKFPDNGLHVLVGTTTKYGQDALKTMQTTVAESDVASTVANGTRQGNTSANNNPFGGPTPGATK